MELFDVFKLYAVDAAKEQSGVVIDLGGGRSMTIARLGGSNRKYSARLAEEYEKYRELLSSSAAEAEELDNEIVANVFAETILLGFEGFAYDGEPLPYSRENAVKILKHPEFRSLVMKHATRLENFKVKKDLADKKKS